AACWRQKICCKGHRPNEPDYSGGCQLGGAISKPANENPGATVQPTRLQSPRLSAACQAKAGTTAWGRSPAARSAPSRSAVLPDGPAKCSASAAPAYQCQASAASTRCQFERSPRPSRK